MVGHELGHIVSPAAIAAISTVDGIASANLLAATLMTITVHSRDYLTSCSDDIECSFGRARRGGHAIDAGGGCSARRMPVR
ncbi:hypothetical protein [Micromonospora sp. NPDC005171]|uniref:hypothetical protein n=1 Tax=Micromonospora sp. NPDC005171 TaxID=3156866 RepID=UPI0033A7A66A